MNPHQWFEEHRTDYVIRSLDPGEAKSFTEHLAGCVDCREAVIRIERELAWLPMGVEPAAMRPGLNRKIADRVLGVAHWRWNRMTTVALAASLLLAVFAYGLGRRENMGMERRLAALEDTVSVMRGASRIVQASFMMDDQPAGIMIFADTVTHRWNVVVHGLPPAGPEQVYQFWFIQKDGMARGAVIHPDSLGPTIMTMGMPPQGGEPLGAALTVEPMHETSPEPRGRELAHIML
jgi:anti-sigma-K factor RskA